MKTKLTALAVLAVAQSVFSDPLPPFRAVTGVFSTFETTRHGEARLDIHGETITNISSEYDPIAKNISIGILEGGVGYSYVTFSYLVPPEGEGMINTYIFTTESGVFEKRPVITRDHPPYPYDVVFEYYARYNASNTWRTDLFSVIFDREACTCSGESLWYYGNGSREVKGGYPNNYFDLVLNIPEGVAGNSGYDCAYPIDDVRSRNVRSLPRLVEDDDTIGLLQRYETIDYTTTPIEITGTYMLPDIVSYEGGVTWFNGTGMWNIIGGGAGFDYLSYNYTQDPYTYGIVDYNFIIKTP